MRLERFETPGGVSLHFALGSADVDLASWEHDATEIEIEGRRDDDATRAAIEELTVEHEPRAGGHVVTVREPRQKGFGFRIRDPRIRVRVRCPEGAAVTVGAGSSDVRTDGTFGSVEIKTGSGDVVLRGRVRATRVTSASGDVALDVGEERVSVTTASGDVRVGRADGELLVNTVSGDVEIERATAGATVQSVSGDARLSWVGGGHVRVQTVSGDATVALAPGVGVWLDVSSVSGDVSSDLELEDAPAGPEATGVVELRAKSVSGDLHVTRAVAAPI
jgi:DUF4097 and DUF4098 domain-containing protein YvlB